jgi:uncharacterized protein (UPF0333 family)
MKGILQILLKFKKNQKGAVVIIFTISLFPVLFMIGAAVDYSRATDIRAKAQGASDAAVLAATNGYFENIKDRENFANAIFTNNLNRIGLVVHDTKLTEVAEDLYLYEVQMSVNTSLLSSIGIKSLPLNVRSKAIAETKGTELAIAIDATNSMKPYINASKKAIKDALEKIKEKAEGSESGHFYVSLVPMSDRINIGDHRHSWIEKVGLAKNKHDDDDNLDNWNGCVEPREEVHVGGFNYAVSDEPPGTALFLPSTKTNDISPDRGQQTCNDTIVGPVTNVDTITDAINSMKMGGTGRFDTGLAWTWRMLSTRWQGEWGVAGYPTDDLEKNRKVLVFLSDGHSTIYETEVGGIDEGGYYGRNNGSPLAFQHFVHTCEQIKKQGIELWAIFVKGNEHFEKYMKDCATQGRYYEIKKKQELAKAFEELAKFHEPARLVE